jgi:hypothetical protein
MVLLSTETQVYSRPQTKNKGLGKKEKQNSYPETENLPEKINT